MLLFFWKNDEFLPIFPATACWIIGIANRIQYHWSRNLVQLLLSILGSTAGASIVSKLLRFTTFCSDTINNPTHNVAKTEYRKLVQPTIWTCQIIFNRKKTISKNRILFVWIYGNHSFFNNYEINCFVIILNNQRSKCYPCNHKCLKSTPLVFICLEIASYNQLLTEVCYNKVKKVNAIIIQVSKFEEGLSENFSETPFETQQNCKMMNQRSQKILAGKFKRNV